MKPKRCRCCGCTRIRVLLGRWCCWKCGEVLGVAQEADDAD